MLRGTITSCSVALNLGGVCRCVRRNHSLVVLGACIFALSVSGCAIDEDLEREPIAAHRDLLVKAVAEIMEPDDRVRLATHLPPGIRILNIPESFYRSKIPLFILFSETRYEVEEGTTRLDLNPLGEPMALLSAPVTPEQLRLMGFVSAFDIIEVPKATKILRSIEHAQHTKLILRDVVLTEEDIAIIKRMPCLRSLCCYGVQFLSAKNAVFPRLIEMDFRAVEPSSVKTIVLQNAPDLERLTVKDTRLFDADIDAICRLRQLSWLSLMGCNLKDDWMLKLLAAHQSLYYLGVHNTDVTDGGLVGVEKLRQLKYFNISRCDVGDATLKRAAKLPRISNIDACYTNVSDAGVQSLLGLPELENLSLMNTKITEKILPSLASKKTLRKLSLKGLSASKETLQKLKDELPNCDIH